jgi:hypothetical protein
MNKIFCDSCGKEIKPNEDYQYFFGIIVEKKISMLENKKIFGIDKLAQNPPVTIIEQLLGKEIYLCRDCLAKFKELFLKEKK